MTAGGNTGAHRFQITERRVVTQRPIQVSLTAGAAENARLRVGGFRMIANPFACIGRPYPPQITARSCAGQRSARGICTGYSAFRTLSAFSTRFGRGLIQPDRKVRNRGHRLHPTARQRATGLTAGHSDRRIFKLYHIF